MESLRHPKAVNGESGKRSGVASPLRTRAPSQRATPSAAQALHEAVTCGRVGILRLLIKSGASISAVGGLSGYTPLMAAVAAHRSEAVSILLEVLL